METRLNHPDSLTKKICDNDETIIWKPGLTERRVITLVVGTHL